jgi:hypothetical protein
MLWTYAIVCNPVNRHIFYYLGTITPAGYAMNLKRFERHVLTFGPSPIQPLERLSRHLGGKVELFAKRED